MPVGGATVEVVRGALGDQRADQILAFWKEAGAAEADVARERLDDAVCVALDGAGEVVGVNSAREQEVGLVGRRLWVYRSLSPQGDDELSAAMFNAAFHALQGRFDPGSSGPIGVCVTVADGAEMKRRPEAIWPEEGLIFAGYLDDGRHLRIRWFWEATTEPGLPDSLTLDQALAMDWSIDDRYSVEPYTGDPEVRDAVLALWERERVVREPEARRRVHETLNVVVEQDEGVIALSTAYVRRNPQIRMDLWYFRTFVASAHRNTHVATQLTMHNRDLLERRFLNGEDTRAGGVCFELQNEGMRKYINTAIWQPVDFIFIGDTAKGVPVRVHYFPGARVPLPPGPRS